MVTARANGRAAVIVPVSYASRLAETLDSVFLQSRPPDDVIVVADGSSDAADLRAAITPYAGRLLLLREPGMTPGALRNAGITVTDAEFVSVLECGDRWSPHFLMSQMHVLRHDASSDLSFTNAIVVGDSAIAGQLLLPPVEGAVSLAMLLEHLRPLPCSNVLARRAAVLAAGGFDPALRHGLDFDLWLRMAGARVRFHGIARPLTLCWRDAAADPDAAIEGLEAAVRAVTRLLERREWHEEQGTLRRCCGRLGAELETTRGRVLLERGELRAALAAFSAACAGPHGWKVRAAQIGLALAPRITRRVYTAALAHSVA